MVKSQGEIANQKLEQQKLEAEKLAVLRAQAEAKQAEAAAGKNQEKQIDTIGAIQRSQVIDQISTLVAPMLSLEDISQAHATYKKKQEGAARRARDARTSSSRA